MGAVMSSNALTVTPSVSPAQSQLYVQQKQRNAFMRSHVIQTLSLKQRWPVTW